MEALLDFRFLSLPNTPLFFIFFFEEVTKSLSLFWLNISICLEFRVNYGPFPQMDNALAKDVEVEWRQ